KSEEGRVPGKPLPPLMSHEAHLLLYRSEIALASRHSGGLGQVNWDTAAGVCFDRSLGFFSSAHESGLLEQDPCLCVSQVREMGSTKTKKLAPRVGLLYFLCSLPAPFALLYVPGKLFVKGEPAATADRIRSSGTLLRMGIGAELIGFAGFIFVGLALYR